MKVNVSQKDIDKGQAENIMCCAVALALRRTFKTDCVEVQCDNIENGKDIGTFQFKINGKWYNQEKTNKPEHINNFIHWFDSGIIGEDGCTPFEFELNI